MMMMMMMIIRGVAGLCQLGGRGAHTSFYLLFDSFQTE